MSVVEIVDHPLIQISLLRDRNTGTKEFRDLVEARSRCCSAMRLPATCPPRKSRSRPPWLWPAPRSAGRRLALGYPILRRRLGMVDGMLNLIPAAKVRPHRHVPQRGDAGAR